MKLQGKALAYCGLKRMPWWPAMLAFPRSPSLEDTPAPQRATLRLCLLVSAAVSPLHSPFIPFRSPAAGASSFSILFLPKGMFLRKTALPGLKMSLKDEVISSRM